MALLKTFTANNGVETSYHKITTLFANYFTGNTTVEIASFVSQKIRDTDQNAFVEPVKSYELKGLSDTSGERIWAYTQMKSQLVDFTGATDV